MKQVNRPLADIAPAHHQLARGHPIVVFGDNNFCAEADTQVFCMPGPHMHTQIEINLVLSGTITYWFDRLKVTVSPGQLLLFWGMVPHQVTEVTDSPRYICLYIPMSVLLGASSLGALRDVLLHGAFVQAKTVQSYDHDIFKRWRSELMAGDAQLAQIVSAELTARVWRIQQEGWSDLRATHTQRSEPTLRGHEQILAVERMSKFILDKGSDTINTENIANASGLHPNYAMHIYKRTMGITVKQALTRHRLDLARSMLIATDFPITRIAFDCGFASLSSFYDAFERRFTLSPGSFRRDFAMAPTTSLTGLS